MCNSGRLSTPSTCCRVGEGWDGRHGSKCEACEAGKSIDLTILERSTLTLKRNVELAVLPILSTDCSISFELTPGTQTVSDWSNIIHFSTGTNNDNHGSRVPGVWFYPDSWHLLVIDGHPQNYNDECPITQPLAAGVKTHIRIERSRVDVKVFVDGTLACSEPRLNRVALSNVRVYASDPCMLGLKVWLY